MRRKKNTGSAAIQFHFPKKTKPVTIDEFTPQQLDCFSRLNKKCKAEILRGAPVSVLDLESGQEVCSFNPNNIEIPDWAIESLARSLLPEIQSFYENEENVKAAKAWAEEQRRKKEEGQNVRPGKTN